MPKGRQSTVQIRMGLGIQFGGYTWDRTLVFVKMAGAQKCWGRKETGREESQMIRVEHSIGRRRAEPSQVKWTRRNLEDKNYKEMANMFAICLPVCHLCIFYKSQIAP